METLQGHTGNFISSFKSWYRKKYVAIAEYKRRMRCNQSDVLCFNFYTLSSLLSVENQNFEASCFPAFRDVSCQWQNVWNSKNIFLSPCGLSRCFLMLCILNRTFTEDQTVNKECYRFIRKLCHRLQWTSEPYLIGMERCKSTLQQEVVFLHILRDAAVYQIYGRILLTQYPIIGRYRCRRIGHELFQIKIHKQALMPP